MKPSVIVLPEASEPELVALGAGLTIEVLTRAVEEGYLARASCTENHPKTHPGTVHRAESIRSLRDSLILSHGWKRECASNQELIVSPDGKTGIAVTSGDMNVGRRDQTPSTKYDSKTMTRRFVAENSGQTEMFELVELKPLVPDGPVEGRLTYMLLTFIAGNEIRAELSLPVGLGENNFVNSWAQRNILPPIAIDGIRLPELPPFATQPDVDVQFKA